MTENDTQLLKSLREQYRSLYQSILANRTEWSDAWATARLNELVNRQSVLSTMFDQVFYISPQDEATMEVRDRVHPSTLLGQLIAIEEVTCVAWWTRPGVTVQAFVDLCRHGRDEHPRDFIANNEFRELTFYLLASGFDIRHSA
jgi:hypothetical protein